MKEQMDEMKRMMQMQMEMQMDTQRAIRQELAAVCSAFSQHMEQNHGKGIWNYSSAALRLETSWQILRQVSYMSLGRIISR